MRPKKQCRCSDGVVALGLWLAWAVVFQQLVPTLGFAISLPHFSLASCGRRHRTSMFLSDGNPPPFDSYYTQATPTVATPSVSSSSSTGWAGSPTASSSSTAYPSSAASSDNPIAILARSQDESVQLLQRAIPDLTLKPALSWSQQSNSLIAGQATILSAYDAPGASNIAWLADVHVPTKLSSLTLFTGPLTSVPHLVSRCSIVDTAAAAKMLELAVDVRPRAYGAYELMDPVTLQYPGPETLGRKAFEYSAARTEYTTHFATPELQRLLDPNSFEQAAPVAVSDLDRLVSGPILLSVTMPVTAANLERIVALRRELVQAYIGWMAQAPNQPYQHRPGAPVNTQYVYDSKFRQNAYLALLPIYQRMFGGTDGLALAVAESGPLDEGYVGGGS
jgi:hypothetical protein